MRLQTFWIWRQDVDYPECVIAWSSELVDEANDLWEKMKEYALTEWPLIEGQHREIEIIIDDDAVMKHWHPDAVEGEVQ